MLLFYVVSLLLNENSYIRRNISGCFYFLWFICVNRYTHTLSLIFFKYRVCLVLLITAYAKIFDNALLRIIWDWCKFQLVDYFWVDWNSAFQQLWGSPFAHLGFTLPVPPPLSFICPLFMQYASTSLGMCVCVCKGAFWSPGRSPLLKITCERHKLERSMQEQ